MCRLGFFWCAVIVLAAAARGAADERARSVLSKAIEAQGGAEALARLKGATYTQAGTVYGQDGAKRPAKAQVAILLPDKLRLESRTPDGLPLISIFDGTRGWVKKGDRTEEMKPAEITARKELMHLLRVTSLVPLRDPAFKLTDLGNSTVDGHAVAGINVSCAGYPDVQLFFDRDTGLLYKLTTRNTDPQSQQQYDREEVTWDYRDVGGMKAATYFRVSQNGKPRVEMKLSDYKCAETLDERLFAKP
jgi:outer membrane lipoprotein-sorting protein